MNEGTPSLALIDYLAFTLPAEHAGVESLRTLLRGTFKMPDSAWMPLGKGWNGYDSRVDLKGYGIAAFGGVRQRGTSHVELTGVGCYNVWDWVEVASRLQDLNAKITRLDIAHDDFFGETVNLKTMLRWKSEDRFTTGGRPPRFRLVDDFGSGDGCTLYVGAGGSGKLLRGYEKGKQLGDKLHHWFRVEVQFRAQSRSIPIEALTQPASYLAGAYPCLSFLSVEQSKIKTSRTAAGISYETMVRNLRTQGGKAINVMCKVNGGDAAAVLEQLAREGVPKRLEGFQEGDYPRPMEGKGTEHVPRS